MISAIQCSAATQIRGSSQDSGDDLLCRGSVTLYYGPTIQLHLHVSVFFLHDNYVDKEITPSQKSDHRCRLREKAGHVYSCVRLGWSPASVPHSQTWKQDLQFLNIFGLQTCDVRSFRLKIYCMGRVGWYPASSLIEIYFHPTCQIPWQAFAFLTNSLPFKYILTLYIYMFL